MSGLRPNTISRVFCALAVLLACLGAGLPAAAETYEERLQQNAQREAALEAKIDRLQERAGALTSKVEVADAKVASAQSEVERLDGQLALLEKRIREVQADLTAAQKKLALLTRELQELLARLDARMDAFKARAVAAYIAGPTAYIEGLFSSQTFSQLIDRFSYYQSALKTDTELAEEIERLRDATEARRDLVEKREELIAKAKARLVENRAAIAAVRAERAAVLAARREALSEKRSLLADVHQTRAQYEEEVAALRADDARLRALLAGTSGGTATGSGQFVWPANGPVTSGYGYRTHPIFGDRRLHAGIDIGAPYGAAVFAADDGVVSYAGVMSGYGNVVVVDHGGGLATVYAHLSSYSVGSGQSVGRGSTIAGVGCTGYCTGTHLHFEVRVNGNPVDPMPYLQ